MNVVKWCKFTFHVKKDSIIAAKDIQITMSVETETKHTSEENYTHKKLLNPSEVSLTGVFNAALGIKDVKKSAFKLANLCRMGKKGYVYFGSTKLMPPKFMGVSAKITDIEIMPSGKWSYCEVQITLKQCEKYTGGTAGTIDDDKKKKNNGSSGSKKKSVKGSSKNTGGSGNTKKVTLTKKQKLAIQYAGKQKSQKPDPTNYSKGQTGNGKLVGGGMARFTK